MHPNEQQTERLTSWQQGRNYILISYNINKITSSAALPGGCIAIYSVYAKKKVIERGGDERNLGRKTQIRFNALINCTIRFILAY